MRLPCSGLAGLRTSSRGVPPNLGLSGSCFPRLLSAVRSRKRVANSRSARRQGRYGGGMDDREAGAALVRDLHWQIDQMGPRGIKNTAGNPYNPSYYKRGLSKAVERGKPAVVEYVRGYLYKPPSGGFK